MESLHWSEWCCPVGCLTLERALILRGGFCTDFEFLRVNRSTWLPPKHDGQGKHNPTTRMFHFSSPLLLRSLLPTKLQQRGLVFNCKLVYWSYEHVPIWDVGFGGPTRLRVHKYSQNLWLCLFWSVTEMVSRYKLLYFWDLVFYSSDW